tara:strand:- start:667 stop:1056 length:390 start_codon:yes stop_codon:yes gene_type:complete
MEIILTTDTFCEDNILIKYSKTNIKIIYMIDNISILGIPLKLKDFKIIYDIGKNLSIELNNKDDLIVLKKINDFFFSKYKKNYRGFINGNIIKLRKNDLKLIKNNDNIYISINNIKKKGSIYSIHTFII